MSQGAKERLFHRERLPIREASKDWKVCRRMWKSVLCTQTDAKAQSAHGVQQEQQKE